MVTRLELVVIVPITQRSTNWTNTSNQHLVRRQEIRTLKAFSTIEFTAQPFLPIKELS